jgi:hypothetical protein
MDINGGLLTQTNGNPATPATSFTGPVVAGTVLHSDGTGNLAGVGGTVGTANAGYVAMVQAQPITQATNGSSAGVFTTTIVIPAQSAIFSMYMMVTAAWTGGGTTFGVGSTASATAFTAASAVAGGTLGRVVIAPGTGTTQIGNWDNVGTTDVQIVITSTNTGTGAGTLYVEYIQGINLAS